MIALAFVFSISAGMVDHEWDDWGGAAFQMPYAAVAAGYEQTAGPVTLIAESSLGTSGSATDGDLKVRYKYIADVSLLVRWRDVYVGYGYTQSSMERSWGDDDSDGDHGIRAGFYVGDHWRIGYSLDYDERKIHGMETTHRWVISYQF